MLLLIPASTMAAPYDYSHMPLVSQQYQPHQYGTDPASMGMGSVAAAYAPQPSMQQAPRPAPAYPQPNFGAAPAGYGRPQTYNYAPFGAQMPAPYGGAEEVRTVFITGFPADVKERELNNLLRFLPGYEASQMNWKNSVAQGFALFGSGALARSACDAITQLSFDDSSVLRCEMARKNMYIKDEPVKRPRTSTFSTPGGMAAPPTTAGTGVPPSGSSGDNPPCNTLYIGNLGDAVQEAELRALFAASAGFRTLKLVHGTRNVNCFVEFEDIPSAQAAHAANQGVSIPSSDRGVIRVQFSKNPFGKKRERESGYGDALQHA